MIAQFGLPLDSIDDFSIRPRKFLEGNPIYAIVASSHVTSVYSFTGSSKSNIHC
jgi:hypothetical protein